MSIERDRFKVYIVTNTVNGKQYVGVTASSIKVRWQQHVAHAAKRTVGLQGAIRKHGADKFTIEHIFCAFDYESCQLIERSLIEDRCTLTPNGYNLSHGGDAFPGMKHLPETKEKISKGLMGRPVSPEMAAKHGARLNSPESNARRKEVWRQKSAAITHCKNGHEYTPENSRINSQGKRICITCRRRTARESARKIRSVCLK